MIESLLSLEELHLINFRSWKELHLTNISSLGLTLLNGVNGAGKSSIRQAIEYLLLDKTSDNIQVDDLPFNQGKDCELYCVIIKNNDLVKIVKYRNHSKNGNQIMLYVNDDDSLTCANRKETQKQIETLLDISEQTLLTSTVFSSKSLSFPESQESDRKKLLYDTLNLYKYKGYYDKAKTELKEIDSKIAEINRNIEFLNANIEDYNTDILIAKQKEESFDSTNKNKIQELETKSGLINYIDSTDVTSLIDLKEKSLIKIDTSKLEKLNSELARLTGIKKQLDTNYAIANKEKNNISNRVCPVFNDTLCDRLNAESETELVRINKELDIIINELSPITIELNKVNDELILINEQLSNNEIIKNELNALTNKLNVININNSSIDKEKQEISDRIESIKRQDNPYTGQIEEYTKKIDNTNTSIVDLKGRLKQLYEDKPYYELWKKGYSTQGIPNLKVEGFLESIELETNKILAGIADQMRVEILGQTILKSDDVREKITYNIHHKNKAITNYHSYSGGERQRVRIADMFAMHSLLGTFNFIILDEVLEMSLDDHGKSATLEILRYKAKELGSLIVISHDKEIQDKFDNVITINNSSGVSEIES